jgi:hypothetical protein
MADQLSVNIPQVVAAARAWADLADETRRIRMNMQNGPDLRAVFGNDAYADKVVPNLQPAVDGSVKLLTATEDMEDSVSKNLVITGQTIVKTDQVNAGLVNPNPQSPQRPPRR